MLLLGLAASTLLSEDGACLAAAALIQQGAITPVEGVAACAAGIYVGDAALWSVGRLARARAAASRLPAWMTRGSRGTTLPDTVDSAGAILLTRFIPGSRLPLYLAAGAMGRRPRSFFFWTFVAAMVWTPVIVLGAAQSILAAVALLAAFQLGKRVDWRRLRQRGSARLARWRRWEFWPSAILYAPVAVHIARLALRHGGLGTLSAANPGIPEGGFVGESKAAILAQLPERWTLRASLIPDGSAEARLDDLRQLVELGEFEFPVILKPDAGQRGVGVRLINSLDEARGYFREQPGSVVVQRFHPGPYEAGIFYVRRPDEGRGRIISVTDKRFPVLVGDGRSSIGELIWMHPRYRLQADVFLHRHASAVDRVLAAGERFRLAIAGNHAQGTLFLDGSHLVTPALEARIDEIARAVPGFYIGRFDVRYSDLDRFARGEDLAIVELNGVTSEATHIYDPRLSLWNAWKVLCEQWTLVFEIGAANRSRGYAPTPSRRLLALALGHLRHTPALPVAS